MKSKQIYNSFLFAILSILITVPNVYAGTVLVYSKVAFYTQAVSTNDANIVEFQSTVTGCAYNRAYVDFNDKSMTALAMTAASESFTVGAYVETAESSRTLSTHGPSPMTCKVISMWKFGY